jgi:hypothetical protein
MSNSKLARVLGRIGAREITEEEVQEIAGTGGSVRTRLTDIMTGIPLGSDHSFDE